MKRGQETRPLKGIIHFIHKMSVDRSPKTDGTRDHVYLRSIILPCMACHLKTFMQNWYE